MLRFTSALSLLAALSAGALVAACSGGSPVGSIDENGDQLADDLGTWVSAAGGIGDPVDINQDGVMDGPGVDTTGDGVADAAALDTDGDGVYDALDTTGDGQPNVTTGITPTNSAEEPGPGNEQQNDDFVIVAEEPPEPVDCDSNLEIIVRDFSRNHPDFGGIEKPSGGDPFIGDEVRRELIQPSLGPTKKPIFLDKNGCAAPADKLSEPVGNCANWTLNDDQAALTTAENFAQWYLDEDGVNYSFDKVLELREEVEGSGVFVYDSTSFFPLSTDEGFGETTGDASDNIEAGKNFLFTTEIHLQFEYVKGQQFTFRGDDDLWVFVNDKLALDLGSMHAPRESTIDFDKQAADLGIEPGQSYSMDIFHAERRWNGSNFRIETNISCFIPNYTGIVR